MLFFTLVVHLKLEKVNIMVERFLLSVRGKLLQIKQSYLSQKKVLEILPQQWLKKATSFMPYMVQQVGK